MRSTYMWYLLWVVLTPPRAFMSFYLLKCSAMMVMAMMMMMMAIIDFFVAVSLEVSTCGKETIAVAVIIRVRYRMVSSLLVTDLVRSRPGTRSHGHHFGPVKLHAGHNFHAVPFSFLFDYHSLAFCLLFFSSLHSLLCSLLSHNLPSLFCTLLLINNHKNYHQPSSYNNHQQLPI